jgi:glucokinase
MTVLVADVGGTRMKWATAGTSGELLEQSVEPTPSGGATAVLEAVLARVRVAGGPLALALPGLVDAERGVWRRSANLGARDVLVREWFVAHGVEVPVLANDVSAAAAGEAAGGSLALLQLGTGVGARIVVAGRPLDGVGGMAGEVGHLVVDPSGPECGCGMRGCVEAIAGWRAVRLQLARFGADDDPRALVDPKAPPEIRRLADRAFDALGMAVGALVTVADPGEIRLGGGVAAAWGPEGARRLATAVRARVLPDLAAATRITLSELGDEAALRGLASLVALTRAPGGPA